MIEESFYTLILGLIVGILATDLLILAFTNYYHKSEMVENGCGQYDNITGEFEVIKRDRLKE